MTCPEASWMGSKQQGWGWAPHLYDSKTRACSGTPGPGSSQLIDRTFLLASGPHHMYP